MILSNVTYINMEHRIDKYAHLMESLQHCPYPTFKTSGVIAEDYLKYNVPPHVSKNQQKYQGVIGCFLAHINALEALLSAKNKDSEYSMIIEDDIIIDPKFWPFIDSLPDIKDADIIFFDSGDNRHLKEFPKYCEDPVCYRKFHKSWPHFVGTHCYVIRNSNLNTVISFLKNRNTYKDIDGVYFGYKQFTNYCFQTGLTRINHQLQSDRLNKTWIS